MTGAAIITLHVAVWWRNGGYCGYMQVATLADAERVAARLHDYRFGDGTIFGCARRSWCGPSGGSPAQVRGSTCLVASVASWKATTTAKRTQQSCVVCI